MNKIACFALNIIVVCSALFLILVFSAQSVHAERPRTIPAIKEWNDSGGSFSFSAGTRIVLDTVFAQQLQGTASTFAEDLLSLSGFTISIVNNSSAKDGDIYLSLSSKDTALGSEGYSLSISGRIIVNAQTSAGVFYGTRSILQILKQTYLVVGGSARDWPDYPERGLMVDVGRHYFSLQFLKNHIRELAFQKLNYFHLHLSDDQGFRIESTSHPEIMSSEYYTKAEMSMLIELAGKYHVQIIPEFDMPGHMEWILNAHADLRLVSSTGAVYPNYLDLSKIASYTLARDIVMEYLAFFPGKYFHLGADEYIGGSAYSLFPNYATYAKNRYGPKATPVDIYLGFIKWINVFVKSYGKQLRIWADPWEYLPLTGTVIGLDTNIVLGIWNAYQNPAKISDSGYSFINASFHPTYMTSSFYGDPQTMYENWAPYHHFGGWPPTYPNWSTSSDDPHVLGAQISVWCETCGSTTESFLADKIRLLLHGLAQNSWDKSGKSKIFQSYTMFISDVSNSVGRAPGYFVTSAQIQSQQPEHLTLLQNYPNPFNPTTTIRYQLSVNNYASLKIYDILGREIAILVNGYKKAGNYEIVWNAREATSGIYFYRLQTDGYMETKKLIFQK